MVSQSHPSTCAIDTNTPFKVHHDVENISPLTKSDLQTFYRTYFHPSSPHRAKASVHLIAQTGSTPTEALKKLTSALSQALNALGASNVDEAALSKSLSRLDLTSSTADAHAIIETVTSYLRDSAGLAEEKIKTIAEQGEGLVRQMLPKLGLRSAGEEVEKEEEVNGKEEEEKKTVVIEDVRAWKASLPASQGPRMVREVGEFEEVGAKL